MIDELDLAFDEHAERGKPRHRRGGRDGKGGGGRSAIAFLMAFVLLGVLGGGAWYGYDKVKGFFTAADYDGPGTDPVTVQVKKNSSLTDIGNVLVQNDVVKSTKAFVQAADENPRGKNIRDGSYSLRKQMAAKDAVALMLDDKSRQVNGVTIPEGKTANQVYAILAKATNLPVKDFQTAAKDPEALGVPDFWFNRRDGQKVTKSIEGFLFPDTYELDPKATAADHLKLMVARFLAVADEISFVDTVETKRQISPYEALTVASLAQAEAGNTDDLGKIARVAYNRIYGTDFPCRCLQFDVGINYYYQLIGKPTKPSKDMTLAELTSPKNPYRTHDKPGLTPTPINNPGKSALEAAALPPAGAWLYFVAIDKQGHSAFATTLDQHNKNIQVARKNGVL
jgi:UPF0755 protein